MNQMQVALQAMKENMEIVELSPLYKAMFEKEKLIKENKVLSDAQFMETIKQKISPDIVKFNLLYSATRDGDSCSAFHFNCDGKGPTLVVITTAKNYIFGGYTDVNWDQSGAYRNSSKAFLFSLNNKKIYPNSGSGSATYCINSYGPTFGGQNGLDIKIGSNCFMYNSNSLAGFYNYSGGSVNELAGESTFVVKELEVYQIVIEKKG